MGAASIINCMDFQSRLPGFGLDLGLDLGPGAQRLARFYGTTPPRLGTSAQDVEQIAARFLDRIGRLEVDGIAVYDVQDESERTGEPRPFPFLPTLDTRAYSQALEALSGLPTVTYKCIGQATEPDWERWLAHTSEEFGVRALSLVGRASSRGASGSWISLPRAVEMARERGFQVGGVAIAERHGPARSESRSILRKTQSGCSFFISQAVYQPQPTIHMLRDYAAQCKEMSAEPQRIVLTFTPCGSPRTLQFLKWLGVAIGPESERAILGAENPLARSIEVCCDSLCQILSDESCKRLPLGINVESVSAKKEEAEAAVALFHALLQVAQEK